MDILFEKPKENYELPEKKCKLTLTAHMHTSVELIYVDRGNLTAYADGKEYFLNEGDIFFAFPNQVHYYSNDTEFEITITKFDPIVCSGVGDIFNTAKPETNVIFANQNSPIHFYIEKLLEDKGDPYFKHKATAFFTLISTSILTSVKLKDEKRDFSRIVFSVIEYCTNNCKENLTLNRVSKDLNISKYYVSRIFSQKIKMKFKDYVNNLRIKEASHLLQTSNLSINTIAFKVGFASYRTFSRCFKSEYGITPSEFKQKQILGDDNK